MIRQLHFACCVVLVIPTHSSTNVHSVSEIKFCLFLVYSSIVYVVQLYSTVSFKCQNNSRIKKKNFSPSNQFEYTHRTPMRENHQENSIFVILFRLKNSIE